ncbi:hypothetical protein [Phreatobacter sp.]|uniref:hypothetical protein n=1 Tax=Phreatobacter sp. TaxID=1966341 RepID=UPI0025D8AFEB|nr:hypothetical protein [Phreatobacter sp.]
MTPLPPIRQRLACSVLEAAQATRAMGRVMLSAAANGATHERIGTVSEVLLEDGHVRLAGGAHDARIDLAVVTGLVADRSGRMKDRVMPRIEFQNAAGETLFAMIALDGLEPFEGAVAGLATGLALPEKERQAPSGEASTEVSDTDPGALPLQAAKAHAGTIGIALAAPGLVQRWQGTVADLRPAMGFINIIQPDFHLHLKAGAVARWARVETDGAARLEAFDTGGLPLGLTLTGPAAVL